jgi:hypothetical protein
VVDKEPLRQHLVSKAVLVDSQSLSAKNWSVRSTQVKTFWSRPIVIPSRDIQPSLCCRDMLHLLLCSVGLTPFTMHEPCARFTCPNPAKGTQRKSFPHRWNNPPL